MSSGDPETRRRILAASLKLMEDSEGREVRIGDIADAAEVSRQAVYLHFANRTDLMVETVRYADEIYGVEARLEACRSAKGGRAVLDAMVAFWGNYAPVIYRVAKGLLATRETDKAAAAAWADRMAVLRGGCEVTVECLVREGTLAEGWSVDEAASMMWAMLSIGTWESLVIDLGWENERYIERMQAALRRMLIKQP